MRAPARAVESAMAVLPRRLQVRQLADRLPKLAEVLGYTSGEAFYRSLVSHWKSSAELVIGGEEPATLLNTPGRWPKLPGLQERMMYLDAMTYLPDDILTKVDRGL